MYILNIWIDNTQNQIKLVYDPYKNSLDNIYNNNIDNIIAKIAYISLGHYNKNFQLYNYIYGKILYCKTLCYKITIFYSYQRILDK